jgi:hypothetical protein
LREAMPSKKIIAEGGKAALKNLNHKKFIVIER